MKTSGMALAVVVGLSALTALAQEERQQPRPEERRTRERDVRIERQDAGPGERGKRRAQPPEAQRAKPRQDRNREGDRPQAGPRAGTEREGPGPQPRIVTPRPRPESDRLAPQEIRDRNPDQPPREQRSQVDRENQGSGLRQGGPRSALRPPAPPENRDRIPERGGSGQDFNLRGPGPVDRPQFRPQDQSDLRRELSLLRQEIQRLERLILESRDQGPAMRGRTPGPGPRASIGPPNQVAPAEELGPGPREPRGPGQFDRNPQPRQPRFQPEQRSGPSGEFRPGPRQPDQSGGPQNPPQRRAPAFGRGEDGPQPPAPPRNRERQPDRLERK